MSNLLSSIDRALIIAPHPDDEVLGCAGTIKKLTAAGKEVSVLTVAVHAPPLYPPEVIEESKAEARAAHKVLGIKHSLFMDRPAALVNQMPHHELNRAIHSAISDTQAEAVFVPYLDRMIDHKVIFDSAMVATRPVGIGKNINLVLAYEVISETHWTAAHVEPNFTPNFFVDISDTIDDKMESMQCYQSKIHPFPLPRSLEALKALALFRGSIIGVAYAEAYHILRAQA